MNHRPESPEVTDVESASGFDDDEAVAIVDGQGEDESDLALDAGKFRASVTYRDWTVETLVSQMRKGRIDLEPSFQRRNAWLSDRKSKLLESILLGFPIPQIVLAESKSAPGTFFVLDGKQRLLTLRQFFRDSQDDRDAAFDSLQLTGLQVLPHLNGETVDTMSERAPGQLMELENHTMRTVVLSDWNTEDLLLSLFLRLNTGSVALSPQELRQALLPGPFSDWLDVRSGASIGLRRLLRNDHADRRMVDADLLLRHLSFQNSSLRYKGNLKRFLDESAAEFNRLWARYSQTLENALDEAELAIDAGIEVFGELTFGRKWRTAQGRTLGRYERALNRAVLDVQLASLVDPEVRGAAKARPGDVKSAFEQMSARDTEFQRAVTATTKTSEAFRVRHQAWQSALAEAIGVTYPLPGPLSDAAP